MAEYVQVALGYWSDPRTLRMKRLVGPLGGEYFLRLEAFAFRMAPETGDLAGFEPQEIAKAVGYPDRHPPEKLLGAFVAATWCDWSTTAGGTQSVRIRSWEDLQPYAVGAERRKAIARHAANSRYEQEAALRGAKTAASHLGSYKKDRSDGKDAAPPKGGIRNGSAPPSDMWPEES